MSPDVARCLLAEYLEVLACEKDELYREHGGDDPVYLATLRLWGKVYKLGADVVFTDDEFAATASVLRHREASGQAPEAVVRAFIVAHRDLVKRRRDVERQVRDRLRTVPPPDGFTAAEVLKFETGRRTDDGRLFHQRIVRDAMDAVLAGKSRAPAPVLVGQRAREPHRRATRTRAAASGGDDDPHIGRRCPRCGSAARPLLPSALWTCDFCADAVWEQLVQHELEHVLAEADWITKGTG